MTTDPANSGKTNVKASFWLILALLAVTALLVGVQSILWLQSLPAWQLSAANSPEGVQVSIYRENDAAPTYQFTLAGHSIPRDIVRVKRPELPRDIGETTFVDETLRPGRWTVQMDGVEIDIMERAVIIDGTREVPPQR